MAQAELHEGSWWPAWQAWLTTHSSERITPPSLGNEQFPPLDAAQHVTSTTIDCRSRLPIDLDQWRENLIHRICCWC
jgi:poly(3-hydroxyalkanoate) synthetase